MTKAANKERKRIPFDSIPRVMAQLVNEIQRLNNRLIEMDRKISRIGKTANGRVVYNTNQVCNILHKHRETIYRMVKEGRLPGYKNGRDLIFYEDELLEWLDLKEKEVQEDRSSELNKEKFKN